MQSKRFSSTSQRAVTLLFVFIISQSTVFAQRFYKCKNHSVPHVATSAEEQRELEMTEDCEGWDFHLFSSFDPEQMSVFNLVTGSSRGTQKLETVMYFEGNGNLAAISKPIKHSLLGGGSKFVSAIGDQDYSIYTRARQSDVTLSKVGDDGKRRAEWTAYLDEEGITKALEITDFVQESKNLFHVKSAAMPDRRVEYKLYREGEPTKAAQIIVANSLGKIEAITFFGIKGIVAEKTFKYDGSGFLKSSVLTDSLGKKVEEYEFEIGESANSKILKKFLVSPDGKKILKGEIRTQSSAAK